MKVEKGFVRLSHSFSENTLSKLKTGVRYSATVYRKLDRNHAILDFQGIRIRAEFLGRIPSGNIYLVLQKKVNNTLYFKLDLQENTMTRDLAGQLLDLSVSNEKNISEQLLNIFRITLKKETPGLKNISNIFEINRLLLNMPENPGKNILKITGLLNILFKNGAGVRDLMLISNLINGDNGFIRQLILILTGRYRPGSKYPVTINDYFEYSDINNSINNFLKLIDNDADIDANEAIKTILDCLYGNHHTEPETGIKSGYIIYLENDQFKSCKYIINLNKILLSLELTFLGRIDILITGEKSGCKIAFFCDKDEALKALKEKSPQFESICGRKYKKVQIIFNGTKQVFEKIIANISTLNLNNIIDIKA